jgi:hypothetical protein
VSEEPVDPHQGPTSAPRYDLGVLLVHGIGVQRRGETLAAFGGPILQWLREWCGGLHDRWVGVGVAPDDLWALVAKLATEEAPGSEDRAATAWALEALHSLLDDLESSSPAVTRPLADAEKALGDARSQPTAPGVLAAGVVLVDARRETPDAPAAPAYAELVIRRLGVDGVVAEERWLIAESWWAETFWSPGFSELMRWGLGVVPWTLGSHYAAAVRRLWAARPARGEPHQVRWAKRLTGAALRLFASLPLALLALAALASLLLVAAIPIPRLRAALGGLQRQIAAIVGDSYILVTRPIEAATMVGQVRRDLEWLAQAAAGAELAILAHSQGAAMTYEALREAPPAKLRLLLAFGSGLRKLEELRNLLGRGGYLQKAMGLTLGGLVGGALYTWVLLRIAWGDDASATGPRDAAAAVHGIFTGLTFAAFAVGGLGLVVAGLWDLLEGMSLADLTRSVSRFARSGARWVDCYATNDPVPNGPLLAQSAELPSSVEVCNESSTTADHTAYWRNGDEFVSLVVSELTAGRRSILSPQPAWGAALAPRRRWRVRWLSAVRWIAVVATVLAILAKWTAWRSLIASLVQRLVAWLGDFAGKTAADAPTALDLGALQPAVGVLLLALVPALAARHFWRRWDATEMRAAIRGGRPGISAALVVAIAAQTFGAAGVANLVAPGYWFALAVVIAGTGVLVWLSASGPEPLPPAPAFAAPPPFSRAGCAWTLLIGAASIYFLVLSWLEPVVTAWIGGSWWKLGGLLLAAIVVVGIPLLGRIRRRPP